MTLRRRMLQEACAPVDVRTSLMAMVDVVFLLMIFFLFGFGPIREQQLVAALTGDQLARAPTPGRTTWLSLRTVQANALEYRVDGGEWTPQVVRARAELTVALASPGADGTVTVDPMAGVSFQAVVDAFALGEHCGAASAALHTE